MGRSYFALDKTDGWSIRENVPELTHPERNHGLCLLLGVQLVRCTVADLRRD